MLLQNINLSLRYYIVLLLSLLLLLYYGDPTAIICAIELSFMCLFRSLFIYF